MTGETVVAYAPRLREQVTGCEFTDEADRIVRTPDTDHRRQMPGPESSQQTMDMRSTTDRGSPN